ncbi:MAG: FAD:protein FMN transferase [Bacillota bacterium]|nr:FAD:protein FMN transferase [Bacillota bacterium]
MKRLLAFILIFVILISSSGCRLGGPKKYSVEFFGVFDTVTQVIGYAESQSKFDYFSNKIEKRLQDLTKLYDIYNTYEGISNLKTINDNAGKQPVHVDKDIINMLKFSRDKYALTEGRVNIALGAVLSIWHDYREAGISDPKNAKLPPMDKLEDANKHTNINDVVIDETNDTVFLRDPEMSLDVGAIAKGYAVEIVAKEIEAEGFTSGVISVGGNVRVIGHPSDGVRKRWGIGLQDPKAEINGTQNLLDTVFVKDSSVVTSGDYQRYYIVDGKRYNHIIDPDTLMSADKFRAVSVVTADSGLADALSTCLFILDYEDGLKLVQSIPGVEACWVMKDDSIKATDGMKKIMKKLGGATGSEG